MKSITFEFIEKKYDFRKLIKYIGHFVKIDPDIKVCVYYSFVFNFMEDFVRIKCYIYGKSENTSFVILPFEYCGWTIYILQKNNNKKNDEWEVQKTQIKDFLQNIKNDLKYYYKHYIKIFSIYCKYRFPIDRPFFICQQGIYNLLKTKVL